MSRGSKGGGSGDGGDRDDQRRNGSEPKSFSDWLDGARPLPKGKERVPIRSAGPKKPPARTDTSAGGGGPEARPAFRFPNEDQHNLAARSGVNNQQLNRLAKGEPRPEERIDLHGMRADAAKQVLAKRFASARARGLRTALVIHGYGKQADVADPDGGSVLRRKLPDWLTKPPLAEHVLALAPAPPRLGGDGATVVLLARSKSSD